MDIISIVNGAFEVYIWLLVARALLSWIRHDPYSPVVKFVYQVTEPVLRPFRQLMSRRSVIDFSPILAFLALQIVRQIIVYILRLVLI